VLLSSQIPADFLRIQGFVTLLDSVFVGRLDDESAQADALRLLKVPVGAGYEQVIASLGRRPGAHRDTQRDTSPRQFVFGDGAGGVERIRIDLSGPHLDHVRATLDTTPDAMREPAAGAVMGADEHAPALPDDDDPTPPRDGSVEEDGSRDEFDLAADYELGLTEDAEAAPNGGAPAPDGEHAGERAGEQVREQAESGEARANGEKPAVDQRGNGSGGGTSPDGGAGGKSDSGKDSDKGTGKPGRVDAA
jgi:hypothetical protein